jgi:FAD/FMN-containing dehydrogenase
MTEHDIQALVGDCPMLDWTADAERVALLSRDFSWFSPILKAELADKQAQVAVRPRDEGELRTLVAACARRRVPLTLRGAGTGNYGQCTPLHGGVLVEMTGLNRIVWQRGGVVRAQAGIRLGGLERRLRPTGWELRSLPSTYRVATLGGLFGGGFGGIGSINYGPISAPGTILGASALATTPEAAVSEASELRGADALALHHNWGTTGIVLEIELALAPAQPWLEFAITFDDFDAALEFGNALALAPGIAKRNIGLLAAPVPGYVARWEQAFAPGRHAALVIVADSSEAALRDLAARHDGAITHRAESDEAQRRHASVMEMCWNHTTLHALKADPGLTYLQLSFSAGRHLDQVRALHGRFGDEVLTHLEFIRGADGALICTALPLLRWHGEARLAEVIAEIRALGIRVNSPHVNRVEDGRFDGVLPRAAVEAKKRLDPLALLNPGKLRHWPG